MHRGSSAAAPSGRRTAIVDAIGTSQAVAGSGVTDSGLFHLIDSLSLERPKSYRGGRHMQSGSYFKTICTECNSARLGARYDPELIAFANSITSILRSSLDLPESVAIPCQPGLLARGVLGHILAVGVGRTERTPLLDAVREFVTDEESIWPEGIEIHYWLYPYKREVLIRDAALAVDLFATHVVFWGDVPRSVERVS
jgi:hypothetical protein